jgi:H+/Cl- antiporter ClcA
MAFALRNYFCDRHPVSGRFRIPRQLAGDFVNFQNRIKGVGIALALLIGCVPVAIILTITASPLWSRFERQFKIEAYGHSGPADWCYLVSYSLLIIICALIWARRFRKRAKPYS